MLFIFYQFADSKVLVFCLACGWRDLPQLKGAVYFFANMKDYLIKKSSAGLGLFANRDYKKDEKIIEYTGEIISDEEAQKRGGKYLFELNDKWTIDGKSRQNIARYINHSCKPNCYAELTDNEKQVFIKAKRAIKKGEELTYHYGSYYFKTEIEPIGCKCASCLKKRQ